MPPRESDTPNTAGFSGLKKSSWLLNWSWKMFSTKCLYMLVALHEVEKVPVSMPSMKRTLKPNTVSLKPSVEPLSSVKSVRRLLGRAT